MDSAVNSSVHKLFKAKTLLFYFGNDSCSWMGGGGRKQALQ